MASRSGSGTGTNLKVWKGAPVRRESGGALIRRKAPENFFDRVPPLFGSKNTISRFGENFRDGQYSLVSFLLPVLLLTVPPCRAICKSGRGHVPGCPMESAPLASWRHKKFCFLFSRLKFLVSFLTAMSLPAIDDLRKRVEREGVKLYPCAHSPCNLRIVQLHDPSLMTRSQQVEEPLTVRVIHIFIVIGTVLLGNWQMHM